MGLKVTNYRIVTLLDTSDPHAAEYPIIFGLEGFVEGDGWVGVARDDADERLTFVSAADAQDECAHRLATVTR